MSVTCKRAALALTLLAAALAGCAGAPGRDAASERRRIARLRELIEATRSGSVLDGSRLVLVARDTLVRDVLRATLPQYGTVPGKALVRLDDADVSFDGGDALVKLRGRVWELGWGLEAELEVLGAFEEVAIDAGSGTLSLRPAIERVEVRRLGARGLHELLGRRVLNQIARQGRRLLRDVVPQVSLPVRLEREVLLKALGPHGPVSVPAARVPLTLSVTRVAALRSRLFVFVDLSPGRFEKVLDLVGPPEELAGAAELEQERLDLDADAPEEQSPPPAAPPSPGSFG